MKTKYLPLEPEIWHSALVMFRRSIHRKKDGKDPRYFSIVENHRLASDKTVQRTVLYRGSQRPAAGGVAQDAVRI